MFFASPAVPRAHRWQANHKKKKYSQQSGQKGGHFSASPKGKKKNLNGSVGVGGLAQVGAEVCLWCCVRFSPTCAKPAVEQKFGIRFKATATGWYYKWAANGMLMRTVNPEMGKVDFGYDPLGRRVWKEVKHQRTCWLWDGNVPLHEQLESHWRAWNKENECEYWDIEKQPLITWVFEEGAFVPAAKLEGKKRKDFLL